MLQIFKGFFSKLLRRGGPDSDSAVVVGRRQALESLALLGPERLPDVEAPFKLSWSIAHDEDFEEILLYEFTTDGGILLHRELATFGDKVRANNLIDYMLAKYGSRIVQICVGPGVGVYASGNNNSVFEVLVNQICARGFERLQSDSEFVKRDGATREIFEPETVLIRSTPS